MTRYGSQSAYADDELDSLRPISSGGNRVITPSKNISQNRSGSNPRSSSATKDSKALYKAIHEIDTAVRAPSRATSRFILIENEKNFSSLPTIPVNNFSL